MNTERTLKRDERTVAIENASFKWAWYFLVWPLTIVALYRQTAMNEEVGDLIALVCASSAIAIAYQVRHKVLVSYWPWRWRKTAIAFAVSIVVAILVLSVALFPESMIH
jgi:hypothetical protein